MVYEFCMCPTTTPATVVRMESTFCPLEPENHYRNLFLVRGTNICEYVYTCKWAYLFQRCACTLPCTTSRFNRRFSFFARLIRLSLSLSFSACIQSLAFVVWVYLTVSKGVGLTAMDLAPIWLPLKCCLLLSLYLVYHLVSSFEKLRF